MRHGNLVTHMGAVDKSSGIEGPGLNQCPTVRCGIKGMCLNRTCTNHLTCTEVAHHDQCHKTSQQQPKRHGLATLTPLPSEDAAAVCHGY